MYQKKKKSVFQEILVLSHQIHPHFVGYLLNIKAFLDKLTTTFFRDWLLCKSIFQYK